MSNTVNAEWSGMKPFRFASIKEASMTSSYVCNKGHYIYVAEVIYVQKDGKLHVVNVCRACGGVSYHEKQITDPGTAAVLLKEKKEKEYELRS